MTVSFTKALCIHVSPIALQRIVAPQQIFGVVRLENAGFFREFISGDRLEFLLMILELEYVGIVPQNCFRMFFLIFKHQGLKMHIVDFCECQRVLLR